MTDEFNLVPTNNLEKHLDNILRAASGEEPQYDLAPNWRVEQYLAAIQKAIAEGGGGGSGGGVLVVTFTNPNNFPKKADYTFEEIKSAYDNGSVLLAKSDASGSMLGQLGYSEAQQGVLANFSGLVMRAAATRIFIDEVKISSDNSVTSTQKKTVDYDT